MQRLCWLFSVSLCRHKFSNTQLYKCLVIHPVSFPESGTSLAWDTFRNCMKKIAIPIWNACVSSVFDFSDIVQLVALEGDRIVSRRDIHFAGTNILERSNRLIAAGPDVLLCGAISRYLADRIEIAGIEVFSLVCGPVDEVIDAYLSGHLARPEFCLPGCKEGAGRCHRRRRGHCGRHD